MELTLPQLDKALQGLVVMSGELEAMGTSIALGQVPGAWEAKAYPSLKPLGPWTDDLMLRLDFIRAWIAQGIPVTFWISGFYFPQAFLTGSMQNYARSHQFPIDTIGFDFIMLDTFSSDAITTKPEDGVYIRGLFLEGARWDPEIRSLNDSRPKQLFSPAPIMHLSPCKDRQEPSGGIYRCPIYKVLSRRGVLSTTGHSTYRGVLASRPTSKKRPPFIISRGDDHVETPRDAHKRPRHAKPPQVRTSSCGSRSPATGRTASTTTGK
jgi:dynein heavy chain